MVRQAVARTTPCLLALFSIVTLLATRLPARQRRQITATAWYVKPQPTFSDALAAVRRPLWREQGLRTSRRQGHRTKRRFVLPPSWAYALCHAAQMAKVELRRSARSGGTRVFKYCDISATRL